MCQGHYQALGNSSGHNTIHLCLCDVCILVSRWEKYQIKIKKTAHRCGYKLWWVFWGSPTGNMDGDRGLGKGLEGQAMEDVAELLLFWFNSEGWEGRKDVRVSPGHHRMCVYSSRPCAHPRSRRYPHQDGLGMTIHTSPLASCCCSMKHNLLAWHLRCFHLELQHNFPVLFPFFMLVFTLEVICS